MPAPKRNPVLLLGFGDQHDALAGRLILLGLRALRAPSLRAGRHLLEETEERVDAALIPVALAAPTLGQELEPLRAVRPGIGFVVTGPRPGPEAVDWLRKAGVRLCLWEPTDDGALRFVVNQALFDSTRGESRGELRVPTAMVARVFSAAGEKVALVYNLSEGGAYLETHRPTNVGGHVRVELPLPERKQTVQARVVSANVPGNLQRPNLPLGMGVTFTDLEAEQRDAVRRFIEGRAAHFRL